MLRAVRPTDASGICSIYNYYIENSIATFEEQPIAEQDMISRIRELSEQYPWLVYELDGEVAGYAYACSWKSRCAYRYSAETSVYLSPNYQGQGIGFSLYKELIEQVKQNSCHSLIAGISLPNAGSIALHEKFGFEKIAHFKQVGWKFEQWIDVGYWQLLLD